MSYTDVTDVIGFSSFISTKIVEEKPEACQTDSTTLLDINQKNILFRLLGSGAFWFHNILSKHNKSALISINNNHEDESSFYVTCSYNSSNPAYESCRRLLDETGESLGLHQQSKPN